MQRARKQRANWIDLNRADTAVSATTALSGRSLRSVGIGVAVAALVIGSALGRVFAPAPGAASATPDALERTETEIGDAAASLRGGAGVPAASTHLTVMTISVTACGDRSTGSALLFDDGHLLTAAHVVGDAGLVRVDHAGITATAEVVGVAVDGRDLAVLSLDAELVEPLRAAPAPPEDAELTLVGHADGGPRVAASGPVVAVAPEVAVLAGSGDIIGVDVAISAGMSGGPAIDATGAVVGLVVAKESVGETALVVATPDLADLATSALAPGECPASA